MPAHCRKGPQLHGKTLKDLKQVVDRLVVHFKAASARFVKRGKDKGMVFPVVKDTMATNKEEELQARYIGATRVAVSKDLFALLQFSDQCPTLDRLWAKASKLTKYQNMHHSTLFIHSFITLRVHRRYL